MLLQLVNSTIEDVRRKAGVGYEAVVGALQRRVARTVDWAALRTLPVLGIDEIALTKGHRNFVAIITAQQADGQVQVLAVLPDRKKATVRAFLESIPPRLWLTMETVCTDMWAGYIHAVAEFAAAHPAVQVVVTVDRYHVVTHYRGGVETLRKTAWRRLKQTLPEAEYAEMVKGQPWLLRKNHRNLTKEERVRLRKLFAHSPELHQAYTLREELTTIFESRLSKAAAAQRLRHWEAKVRRSGLTCFDKFLKTLEHRWDNILNYFLLPYICRF